MNTPAGYTYRDTFNRYVESSIANGNIHRELKKYCDIVGEDYDTVTEHIAREWVANSPVDDTEARFARVFS